MTKKRKKEIQKDLTKHFEDTLEYFLVDPSFWWGSFYTQEEIDYIEGCLRIDLENKKIVEKES